MVKDVNYEQMSDQFRERYGVPWGHHALDTPVKRRTFLHTQLQIPDAAIVTMTTELQIGTTIPTPTKHVGVLVYRDSFGFAFAAHAIAIDEHDNIYDSTRPDILPREEYLRRLRAEKPQYRIEIEDERAG